MTILPLLELCGANAYTWVLRGSHQRHMNPSARRPSSELITAAIYPYPPSPIELGTTHSVQIPRLSNFPTLLGSPLLLSRPRLHVGQDGCRGLSLLAPKLIIRVFVFATMGVECAVNGKAATRIWRRSHSF